MKKYFLSGFFFTSKFRSIAMRYTRFRGVFDCSVIRKSRYKKNITHFVEIADHLRSDNDVHQNPFWTIEAFHRNPKVFYLFISIFKFENWNFWNFRNSKSIDVIQFRQYHGITIKNPPLTARHPKKIWESHRTIKRHPKTFQNLTELLRDTLEIL